MCWLGANSVLGANYISSLMWPVKPLGSRYGCGGSLPLLGFWSTKPLLLSWPWSLGIAVLVLWAPLALDPHLSDVIWQCPFEAISWASVLAPRPESTCANCGGLFILSATKAKEDMLG